MLTKIFMYSHVGRKAALWYRHVVGRLGYVNCVVLYLFMHVWFSNEITFSIIENFIKGRGGLKKKSMLEALNLEIKTKKIIPSLTKPYYRLVQFNRFYLLL